MPSARSATTAAARGQTQASGRQTQTKPRRSTTRRPVPRPRRVPLRSSVVRVRWERLGRIALLVVLAAVIGLYAEHALSYLTTRAQNEHEQAVVSRLSREHAALQARRASLNDHATIVRLARGLGMTRSGEQPYAIIGQAGR
jgi:cell division protein FtsB